MPVVTAGVHLAGVPRGRLHERQTNIAAA
jgi:hypothetical protein